ncbi:hypothetical protein [Nocardia sp. NRRL S-836]|uniref:hypothetical protein n=1 Tax=Nocardia sp. NRRL S-836 TaxID=1519492 RepID=UPI000AF2D141|nr:hypothetical protein [Nocardia sp. NRRL S-836]
MRRRFLVLHDYGMGGLSWWIWAESAEQIVLTLAEAEVITDPDALAQAEQWGLDELELSEVDRDPALRLMREERAQQRGKPGFGVLAGRERVYLRTFEEGLTYLVEIGQDGRQLRQVEVKADGTLLSSAMGGWPINPPIDLHDPRYVPMEITEREFEDAWSRAVPDPAYED